MRRVRKIGRSKDRLYKKYVAHMNDPHRRERFKIFVDGVALSLPLLAAFSLYISLVTNSLSFFRGASPAVPGVYLSPGKAEPMIIFILVFIVAYSVFLMFEYNILRKRLAKIEKIKSIKKLH